jgi:hypothetical protein
MSRFGARTITVAALAVTLTAGCRRGADPGADAPTAFEPLERRIEMRIALASRWSWNLEDSVRIAVVNGTTDTVAGVLHLFVAAPVDLPGSPAGADVVASGEGTRISIGVVLAPGATAELRQRLRTPPAPGAPERPGAIGEARAFPLRAWFVDAAGTERAAAADTLRIPVGSEVVEGGCGAVPDAEITRYGIGPVRLRMLASEVRALCPEARDTTWRAGRARLDGMTVRIAGHPVVLRLDGERVGRVEVHAPGLRTPSGAGVGATAAELRARHGRVCAGADGGRVTLRFPSAPGIVFALDTADARPAPTGAVTVPDSARVAALWVDAGDDDCPIPHSPPVEVETT